MKPIKIPDSYKYIAFFLTMRCNLSCSFCLNAFDENFSRRKFLEELTGEEWVKVLNRIESGPEVPITFSGGEPGIHKDFIYIINNLKKDLNIDILTNLSWGKILDRFIEEVDSNRLKRNSPYPSIRVSYHPEQMDIHELIKDVKKMQDAGFSIGIWAVLYPSNEQLSAINRAQFICRDVGIDFRVKEYTGIYKGEMYGDYSKYPGATEQKSQKKVLCKISELIIGPNGNVYRCHRNLYAKENSVGNLLDDDFQIDDDYRKCDLFGFCHSCDVKVKTNYKQELGCTSVKIKSIDEKQEILAD